MAAPSPENEIFWLIQNLCFEEFESSNRIYKKWLLPDLNWGPLPHESNALPLS